MQRIDDRVVKKVNELVKDGVTSVAEMERHLGFYVKKELYDGLPLPDPGNRRFFPSRNDIYNIMYTASIQMRHSKIDQEELAHKIAEWQQESPQNKFFLRPSTKSASESFESAQEVLEEDDIMWQMNDADLHADKQSTDLLFVHQTHWQRTLLEKYGNEICLLDATYKTSRHALPLFFLCIKTNVNYCVVIQHETRRAIAEALVVRKMVIRAASSNYQDCIKKTNKIPEYARDFKKEYLLIIGINKIRFNFISKYETDSRKLFVSRYSDRIKYFIKRFLKGQERGKLKDILVVLF